MITFGMFDITNLRKKFYKKIEEPCEQKLQGALFFSHRKQVNIQSAIYTCTYTYNYDKVRASYIYARKKPLLK